jgi:hypothetical protein
VPVRIALMQLGRFADLIQYPSGLLVLGMGIVLRLLCLCKYGRFHEHEPEQRDTLESGLRVAGYGVGTSNRGSPKCTAG